MFKPEEKKVSLDRIHNRFLKIQGRGYPLSFIFFEDRSGKERNIVYNEGSYFELLDNKKFYRLCPLSEVEHWINEIQNGNFRLIGKGHLKKPLLVNRKSLISRDEAFEYMEKMESKKEVV